ncbi:MAG: DUF1353 domain-containing protein [Actinomycetota bacterium]|nr:DUF1353 domain-containing protein [Actinomycetota bacterium]
MSYYLVEEAGPTIHVPPGFKTDFASVPRPFWFWIAPWGRHGRAAILHDFLYQLGSVTEPGGRLRRPPKREADRIFRDAMAVLDNKILSESDFWSRWPKPILAVRLAIAVPRRWLMWAAVALFGFPAYKRQQHKGSAPPLEHEMLERIAEALTAKPQGDAPASASVPSASS